MVFDLLLQLRRSVSYGRLEGDRDDVHHGCREAFGSVRQRVATHLLDLASDRQRPGGRLVARVSQQELADAAGSVREVVARALRDLRAAGMVATAADRVVILDHREAGIPTSPARCKPV